MLTAEELDLARELWLSGDLSWICRKHAQTRLYEAVRHLEDAGIDELNPLVFKCHRRLGKSFVLLLLLLERCIRLSGQICVFGAPTFKQVKKIALPNMQIILRTCPDELRPTKSDDEFIVRNPRWPAGSDPSILRMVGVDVDNGDRLRGAWCDAAALDEVRDMANPKYLVEDVLSYQFRGRRDPWIVLATTPPKSAAHEFESHFVQVAQRTNAYFCFTVADNQDWTPQDDKLLLKAVGGSKNSISWRREAMCESIGDPDELILPEFQENETSIVTANYDVPPFFYPQSVLDTGWNDWNAALFMYVDFKKQQLVVQDEYIGRYKSTGTIAKAIQEAENRLWGFPDGKWVGGKRPSRVGDLTDQALEDLGTDHKVGISPVEKYNREAAIANLRTGLQEGRVVIDPRCKNLIYQCRNGIWNDQRSQFLRSKDMGHCDALAALVYGYRMANWGGNPYPGKQALDENHWDPAGDMLRLKKKRSLQKIVDVYS